MQRLRRHRLRTRLSLLAMITLLWSQLLLASHPACSLAEMALGDSQLTQTAHADESHCDEEAASASVICDSHCAQGDLNAEVTRVLAVPAAVLPAPMLALRVQCAPVAGSVADTPWPAASWHRPTAHPASLLLI